MKKIVLILLLLIAITPTVQATWWNNEYSVRYLNDIPNGVRPYQLNLTLHTGYGTNNATDIYGGTNFTFDWINATNNTANINFNVTLNNITTLSFYIANITNNNQTAVIWININGNGQVQIYAGGTNYTYNNSQAGKNTFPFFDDFSGDLSLWTISQSAVGNVAIDNGRLKLTGNTDWTTNGAVSVKSFNVPFTLHMNTSVDATSTFFYSGINSGLVSPATNGINVIFSTATTDYLIYPDSPASVDIGDYVSNRPYITELILPSTGFSFYRDGIQLYTNGVWAQSDETKIVLDKYAAANFAYVDDVFITNLTTPYQVWATWSEGETARITSWYNNYTNDDKLTFVALTSNIPINFSIITSSDPSFLNWTLNDVDQGINLTYYNHSFVLNGTYNITVKANFSDHNSTISWVFDARNYTLNLTSPLNQSAGVSIITILTWLEWPNNGAAHNYYVSTDNMFINIISSGTYLPTNENYSATLNLNYNTKYYWKVKNATGTYSSIFEFTTTSQVIAPGEFNITLFDEQNTSLRIMNFTTQLSNMTHTLAPKTTSTGWTNYSGNEVISGQYLIIAIPNSPYYQRMVLATSPSNVTMYVPNSTSPNIIDLISFSLLDVTGFFPYQTSTITLLRGGLVMDKAYFSADGTHPVYLLQGNNYQIQIQNGNNLQSFANFVPLTSATSQIVINDFSPNMTQLNPFTYNMTYNTSKIILNWNDVGGVLSLLTFTVGQGTNYSNLVQICSLTTSVSHGQSICSINNNSIYNVSFSARLTDGTYQNSSFYIDYTKGKRQDSSGTSTITGSPIGIGFKWNYGTFTMPDWVYTWVILIVIILLGGTFGTYHAGIGGIIILIMTLIFESVGLFRPFGSSDPDNLATMGITGGILIMVILYYLQHRDKGG